MKTNKIALRKTNNVKKGDIHTGSLEQIQTLVNEDTNLVYNALIVADYIDELEAQEGNYQAST